MTLLRFTFLKECGSLYKYDVELILLEIDVMLP